jgi:hypothetical protein
MAACDGVPLMHGVSSAASGGGEFGQHGIPRRPGLRGEVAADRGHAVEVLLTEHNAAAFGAVDVAEVPVGV